MGGDLQLLRQFCFEECAETLEVWRAGTNLSQRNVSAVEVVKKLASVRAAMNASKEKAAFLNETI